MNYCDDDKEAKYQARSSKQVFEIIIGAHNKCGRLRGRYLGPKKYDQSDRCDLLN